MINFSKYKSVLWDFDGVLMDSMPIREEGFRRVLSSYPEGQVRRLLEFHQENGGLSRYVKFRYFFETIREESIGDRELQDLATAFSGVMMQLLLNKELLINDSLDFVKKYSATMPMHIVSGSDGIELNEICQRLDIAHHFKSIHGSPTPKDRLIRELIASCGYDRTKTVLIGDSINDYDAAVMNDIDFIGYNNSHFDTTRFNYIASFENVAFNDTAT